MRVQGLLASFVIGQDVDDWLQLVLDHRRLPPNDKTLDQPVFFISAVILFVLSHVFCSA